jgi:hemolysin III
MYRFREPVNGFTHLLGAALGFVGLIYLITLTHNDTPKMISLIIYGVSMIALYLASASFHLYNGSRRNIARLNRIDHAAIYLFIAGSFTPFGYNLLDGRLRWGFQLRVIQITNGAVRRCSSDDPPTASATNPPNHRVVRSIQ